MRVSPTASGVLQGTGFGLDFALACLRDSIYKTYRCFFQHRNTAFHAATDEAVRQHHWNRDTKTKHGGHQCLGNTRGEHARITGTMEGDQFKGMDHPGYGAQKPQKRSDRSENCKGREKTLLRRYFCQNRLLQDILQLCTRMAHKGEPSTKHPRRRDSVTGAYLLAL